MKNYIVLENNASLIFHSIVTVLLHESMLSSISMVLRGNSEYNGMHTKILATRGEWSENEEPIRFVASAE